MAGGTGTGGTDLVAMRARSAALFAQFGDADATEAERSHYRDELVRLHLPLVEHFARRFLTAASPSTTCSRSARSG